MCEYTPKLMNEIYDQVVAACGDEEWENDMGMFVQKIIEMTLLRLPYSSSQESTLSPPPDWQSVHIGEGVFVPTDNPELECEVVWWNA